MKAMLSTVVLCFALSVQGQSNNTNVLDNLLIRNGVIGNGAGLTNISASALPVQALRDRGVVRGSTIGGAVALASGSTSWPVSGASVAASFSNEFQTRSQVGASCIITNVRLNYTVAGTAIGVGTNVSFYFTTNGTVAGPAWLDLLGTAGTSTAVGTNSGTRSMAVNAGDFISVVLSNQTAGAIGSARWFWSYDMIYQ